MSNQPTELLGESGFFFLESLDYRAISKLTAKVDVIHIRGDHVHPV